MYIGRVGEIEEEKKEKTGGREGIRERKRE